MEQDETPTADEQTLAPIINATNLPAGLKGKAQRIFLRFREGSLAHPYVRQVRDNLDDMEARSRINMMVAEEIGRQAIADPAFMERARARLLGETVQKQENLESVLIAANAKIESEAPRESSEVPEGEPSQDWINAFTREAELASSDDIRERLAAILAGEIMSPGSISRSTIRTVAEMDKSLLEQLQSILPYRLWDAILKDDDWTSGSWFAVGLSLENAGLINGVTGSTYKEIKINEGGVAAIVFPPLGLVIRGVAGHVIRMPSWLLTRTGQEIADVLKPTVSGDDLKQVVSRMDKENLEMIYLGPIVDGTIRHSERLWPIDANPPGI